jgi:hypothetical protein
MCTSHAADDPEPARLGPHALLANLRQPGPLSWKLQRLLTNNVIKITRRRSCCGHPGEPGC